MDAFRRFKAPHTLKRYSIATVQLLCFVHLFNEHVAEIRMVRLCFFDLVVCKARALTRECGFVFEQTTGRSMVPTLSSSTNLLLVESLTRTFTSLRPLRRGDIVTAINPVTKHPVCKRIVATEGQAVHTRVANLAQAALTRSIPVSADASSVLSDEPHWVSIPKGHVWLVGDNEDRTYLYSRSNTLWQKKKKEALM